MYPAWEYAIELSTPGDKHGKNYKYLKCKFYMTDTKGEVARLKDHLIGTRKNSAPCQQVPAKVKEKMLNYLEESKEAKQLRKQNFENLVDDGAYFGGVQAIKKFNLFLLLVVLVHKARGELEDQWINS